MPEQSTLGMGKVCNDLRLNSRYILNDALHLRSYGTEAEIVWWDIVAA